MESAIKDAFKGTNAVFFAYKDPSASAKALTEFAKDVEELVVKTGVMDGKKLNEDGIKYLATLPLERGIAGETVGTLQAAHAQVLFAS